MKQWAGVSGSSVKLNEAREAVSAGESPIEALSAESTSSACLLAMQHQLQAVSSTPRLDAEILLASILAVPRSSLYAHPERKLALHELQQLTAWMARARAGEPIAYILGQQEFYALPFKVTSDTLIPRPETESLVDWVLAHANAKACYRVLDLGTGSGAIACALAHARPSWYIAATDQSHAALAVAEHNAKQLQLSIEFFAGDWFSALPAATPAFDIIIANPPYVAATETVYAGAGFEPAAALFAAQHGFAALHTIVQTAGGYLKTDGYLLLEHGSTQQAALQQFLNENYFEILHLGKDLFKKNRFIAAQHSSC